MAKEYLGDGLYADFDGWHIILSADRDGTMHWVALEPDVYRALREYVLRLEMAAAKESAEEDA